MRRQIILALVLLLMNNCFVHSVPTNSEVEQKIKEIGEKKCDEPADPGTCKNTIRKWYFDVTTKECKEFVWTGCDGNQNRFENEEECLYHCLMGESQVTSTTTTQSTTTKKVIPTTKRKQTLFGDDETTIGPVAEEERGSELTFKETGYDKTFMFAKNNTFIQMDGPYIQTFQLRLCREISFQFRTRLPHGLLVYHNVKTPDGIELEPYALYVIVEKGQLKVVHVFGKHATSVTVGEGLNRDDWHSVMVRIDVHGARLIARVDENQEEVYLKGLNHETNYGVSKNLPSVVLVGGLSSEEKLHGVKYIIESFVGCIRNVVLSSGKAASDLLPITPLIATKHENVAEGCFNRCHTRHNLCFVGSKCINHYYATSCDCFGTEYEGELCDLYTATTLTLRGSSHVSYRIYDWKDRVHSPATRISLIFKTRFDDSVLFYASGESVKHQYIAASIKNKTVYVEMDFGEGIIQKNLDRIVTNNIWHNLTIVHCSKNVTIFLDYKRFNLEVPGSVKKILFDPEIYFGGGPYLSKKKGLTSTNKFVGSLKYVFYNDVSILYELKKGNPKVHYIGVLQEEYNETDVDVIPITFPFATSHIWWPIVSSTSFNFKFDFRSSRITAVLAFCDITTLDSMGYWELRLQDDKISFDLTLDINKNITETISIRMSTTFEWHTVDVNYMNGDLRMSVDHLALEPKRFDVPFNVSNRLIIGSSLRAATTGLVGCIKNLRINNTNIDSRNLMETEQVVGEVALDNCNYIDPCKRPNTCEHGGKCFVKDDRITCDCTGTGYVGKNCHFTEYRKTCEELALLGFVKSDVYLIDIDGNGVFPPAHVKCEFQSLNDETITVVEHNLPSQVDVRSRKEIDFSFNIKYREFSPEMLQELISHSLYCKQNIRYDCYKAPLELYSSTWFTSSANNFTVDYLGSAKRGSCECAMNKTCENPTEPCNCDNIENKWYSDYGEFKDPRSLGITGMYFLQQRDLDEEAQGRVTLGPLECVETNTQRYVVTFTTSQSYIEVPGWRKGDIAFSFRTTGEKAILLFQPPIRPNYPSFMVALTGENQLTFNFTLNTGTTRELVINSTKKLNAGEWHKIWIDYNEYHVRFMINKDHQMVDLLQEEEFGPFEGSMFIGGATADLSKKLSVKQGLIGCFRGLVVNGEILDIYSYMSVHLSEIIKDCKPSCVPSPCKNGAQCKELWSTFQCVCDNQWAHVGEFCEQNLNDDALTFVNRSSYFIRNYVGNHSNFEEKEKIKNILTQNLLLNLRTYDTHSLVLYANDHYNNFVSLYITNSKEVVFLFNNDNEIVNLTIVYEEMSTNANASMQIAIIRTETSTTMHVNHKNVTIDKGCILIEEYSNKPWINPELEILSPHRPIAPPTDYFQLVIGGYDVRHLLRTNPDAEDLQGYIGCVRGFKIGNNLIEIEEMLQLNEAYVKEGVLLKCQMSCDLAPCKNGGICTENFEKRESTCDCDQTSFIGEHCSDEKGADFIGESIIQRKFILKDKVDTIKLQLAFSSGDLRRTSRIMLLIQTENDRNYYVLVGITPEGYLQFEEDREQKEKYVAIIKKNFLNNVRHSVYYYRNGDNATLIIDRQAPEILKHEPRSNTPQSLDSGTNEVQIGGINTTDSRFSTYKSYTGCLSNIFIQVNNYTMKPLEEYMLFTKTGADNITVVNGPGVRSGQCHAYFEIANNSTPELPLNNSLGTDKTWVEPAPKREPYKSIYINSFKQEEKTQFVFITLVTLFVVIIICCIIEVYRTHVAYKKRIERETDEGIIWSKEQATKLHESPGIVGSPFSYKPVPLDDANNKIGEPNKLATNLVGILKNGNTIPIPNNIQTTIIDELTAPNQNETPDEKEKEALIKGSLTESQLLDQELEAIDETEELLNVEEDEQNNYSENSNPNSNYISEARPVSMTLKELAPLSSCSEVTLDRMDLQGELHQKTDELKEQLKVENKLINELNSQHLIRPRQRQVSWGPPPIAPSNSTQLPFKIEESPTDSHTSHNL